MCPWELKGEAHPSICCGLKIVIIIIIIIVIIKIVIIIMMMIMITTMTTMMIVAITTTKNVLSRIYIFEDFSLMYYRFT